MMSDSNAAPWIEIDTASQRLTLRCGNSIELDCRISTAKNGVGELHDSECTPRGEHVIAEKIGEGEPLNTVFVARRPTGQIYSKNLRAAEPNRDWILTRILWLAGCEAGRNQGGAVDTKTRYIYIHGAPGEVPMGEPGSRGCIRMRNEDLISLFDRVFVGTRVLIT